jgi:hypothetical protein
VCDRKSVAEVELCDRMSACLTQKHWLCYIREAEYCFDELSKVLSIVKAPDYSEETSKRFTMISTFPAKSRSAVDAFYATAMKKGARDNGKPSFREEESYAASVLDPDGHHIEVVCHNPDN